MFEREMNEKGEYVVIDKIKEGFEWVFTDESVMAIEKLHGTNVSILIENGVVTAIFNRTERIPFINKGKKWIVEGILNAFERGYIDLLGDGQHFGELVGETFGQKHLKYKSWGKYPEKDLIPLYACMIQGEEGRKNGFVEGVVFTHPDGRMAKLRKDMYVWYKGKRHNDMRNNGEEKNDN
jgi:hypothetical protein